MVRKLLVIFGIIVIGILSFAYINQRYFFNPVVFSQDRITPYDWNTYERPITMTYYSLEGEKEIIEIENEQEIRNILKAMKDSPEREKVTLSNDVNGALKMYSDSQTVLEVYFYSDHWQVLKNDRPIYEMTQSLDRIVNNY